jgi:hypothetical protein
MTKTKTLIVIGCLLVAGVVWNRLPIATHAGAERPKGVQKWEYATLTQVFPPRAVDPYHVTWRTGKQRLEAKTRTAQEGVASLNQQLRGTDLGGRPPFGALLDRIGQEGWELVTYTERGPEGNTQTWTFKRPVR